MYNVLILRRVKKKRRVEILYSYLLVYPLKYSERTKRNQDTDEPVTCVVVMMGWIWELVSRGKGW